MPKSVNMTKADGTVINDYTMAAAITPSNTVDLTTPTAGLYVGVTGDVKVDMVGSGTGVIFVGLAAGVIHRLQVKHVYATGTTATGIVGVS